MANAHLHEDPSRTTPLGMARYASDFMEAALAVDEKMGRKDGYEIIAPVPAMFLAGQAIELSLKAYLLQCGVSLRDLRTEYGHNLTKSLEKCIELGLFTLVEFSEDELSTVHLLNEHYSSKQLQFIVTGAKTFPVFGPLERFCLKLIRAVCNEVGFTVRNLPEVH